MVLPAPATSAASAIRVLIVDDSAVVRGLVLRWLQAEPGIEIAGLASNGRIGVEMAGKLKPDVIILDVEMPELDGLGAIPEILAATPQSRILMASTLTQRNAEITLKAMALGAADYLPKPDSSRLAGAADFKRDLLSRIKALGARRRISATPSPTPRPSATPRGPAPTGLKRPAEILAIGSSTGGPQALQKVIAAIGGRLTIPILIVQHMPPMFTTILADHLGKLSSAPVFEAKDGMPVRPGTIYVAPGDFHMRVAARAGAMALKLDQGPQVHFCRPAVDPMFASVAEVYGGAALACVLTGMGSDGRLGAEAIVAKGGAVVAQDEATSVVWGMPGAVVQANLAAAVKPIEDMGQSLLAMARGGRP